MIKLINKSDEIVSIKTDMDISLANAIRRSVNYIPTLAVDSLEISKNDSALYDEIIAHRVGLIPLKDEKLKLPKECGCEKEDGCGKCSIKLKLSASGPCVVYSDELSPKSSIVYKMPITILDKDQELEFVATARMGLGIEHAKFAPGMIYYRYAEDLENEEDEAFNKLVEKSKKSVEKELSMFIESWGQIPAKEIFTDSIDILNKEIKELVKEIK
ncbi:MAG: DNA-directed RNA polymerase subunit D [archaeon]|nr:DNA-directed RNA polymerase subunit D [archaeon]